MALRNVEVYERLLRLLPELAPGYAELLERFSGTDPGGHNVFGDLLDPYLDELLSRPDSKEKARSVFAFLEELASAGDEYWENVVWVTVCEYICGNPPLYERAVPFMGAKTFSICKAMRGD